LKTHTQRGYAHYRDVGNDHLYQGRFKSFPIHVNAPQTEAEVDAIRRCLQRGQPFGGETWVKRTAERLGLTNTLRPRGRPKKKGS
jgi:hypothetical protein